MGRFASTVAFYERSRPPYGPLFFETVARRMALSGTERLIDLGTGPGVVALGFAPFVAELVGVDPEPAMIAAARAAAGRASAALRLIEGRAEDLSDDVGLFDVVTIGRALHWMDPAPTRALLDRLVAPHGFVVICRSSPASRRRNPWLEAYDRARAQWGESKPHERHALDRSAFFAGTRFRLRETVSVDFEQDVALAAMVDRVLSMSTTSPDRVGAEVDALRDAVGGAIAPFASDGILHEAVEARAEIFASSSHCCSRSGEKVSARRDDG